MKLTPKAREALIQVRNKFRRLEHEELYNQDRWGLGTGCMTAACVAGHIALNNGWEHKVDGLYQKSKRVRGAEDIATEILGLDPIHLFSPQPQLNWPEPFASEWAAGERRKSHIAADYIDAILQGKTEP